MKSVIEWQKGKPKADGKYLLQTKNDGLQIDYWSRFMEEWATFSASEVIAWCREKDINGLEEEV